MLAHSYGKFHARKLAHGFFVHVNMSWMQGCVCDTVGGAAAATGQHSCKPALAWDKRTHARPCAQRTRMASSMHRGSRTASLYM